MGQRPPSSTASYSPDAATDREPEGTDSFRAKQHDDIIPGLYLVATPIGNLEDITYRAVRMMRTVDLIACEDKRVTAKLLAAFGIKTRSIAYHDHNARRVRPQLIQRLQKGDSVALLSDAGTPVIADPGYKLVRACIDAGIRVIPIPGPNAAISALTTAGLPTDQFLFVGFLPTKLAARRRQLESLASIATTLVFYESPRRLAGSLHDMARVLGPRGAAIAREMTKLHEEFVRDSLPALAQRYDNAPAPKGEIVIVVGPPDAAAPPTRDEIDTLLRAALAVSSLRDAAAAVAQATGLPRREVYARAVALRSSEPK